jgi:hypothetical protein
MATVSMPIEELDKLREDLKNSQKQVKKLESEKMQVIVNHKADGYTLSLNGNLYKRNGYMGRFGEFDYTHLSNSELENAISITSKNADKDHIETVNLDSIKTLLKNDIETQYQDRMKKLIENASNVEEQIAVLNKNHKLKLEDLKLFNEESEKKLKSEYKKEIVSLKETEKKLNEEINDLKSDKKKISLEKQIVILKENLKKEKNKKWYQKLFKQ